MAQSVYKEWSSSSLFRPIGYCLLLLGLFDIIDIFVPLRFMNPNWEFQMIGSLVERLPVALLGLGLVFYGKKDIQSKWELPILKFLSWASLLVGILLLLLSPLLVVDSLRLKNQINHQINTEVTQQLSQLERIEKQVSQGTDSDITNAMTRLNQGMPLDIKNPQEVKSKLLAEINQAKGKIRTQTETAWVDRRLALVKNSVKWLLGVLVLGVLFIYIWRLTP